MSDLFDTDQDESGPGRARRVLPWVLVVILLVIGGALFWANNRAEKNSPAVAANQSTEQPRANDETKQTLAALQQTVNDLQSARQRDEGQIADLQRQLSAEQGERKLLSDQVGALAGRVDGLEKARAEFTGPANRRRGR
ncbi:hypothetical protein [Bradyrhizobium sp. STM 3562]|uniref:hypothetical protein n=1 Tax=Bradyrhizobium sp. STM 3562 TaxID=578924 RepID=UPI00388DBAB7